MPRTSNKAELIMDYVNQFIQENGYSPSVREIGAAVGLRSTASVSYHLQALQDKGLLASPGAKGRKRALVTGARPGQIPVVGVVTAGMPILAVENQEGTMPWSEPGCFALRVRGLFADNLMVTAQAGYNHSGIDEVSDVISVGLGARYYIIQNGLYLGLNTKLIHANHNYNDIMPGLEVGYAFFLSKTVTVEPAIYYDQSFKNHSDFSKIGLRVGFGIYL